MFETALGMGRTKKLIETNNHFRGGRSDLFMANQRLNGVFFGPGQGIKKEAL